MGCRVEGERGGHDTRPGRSGCDIGAGAGTPGAVEPDVATSTVEEFGVVDLTLAITGSADPRRRGLGVEIAQVGPERGDVPAAPMRRESPTPARLRLQAIQPLHNAIGAPFTTKRFVEFVAAETGISVTDLLAGSERLRVEIEQAYPPA